MEYVIIANYAKMEKDFPNDKNGLIITNKIVKEIKRYYGNKEFNCICGISGGETVCSQYTISKEFLN